MRRKVFVVDDEKQIAEALGIVLREAGFDVESFYDGPSALLISSQRPPDILISDIQMPRMDGITLAKALREQSPNCKVILMSGNPVWMARAQEDGFVLFPKPFSARELLRFIKS